MSSTSNPAGLVETRGTGPASEAADRLVTAIEANEKLRLVARVDHGAGAQSVGLELSPIVEVFFGNPTLGTPLMQLAPTAGIDLPQKMLLIEDGDQVRVLHNDPEYLAERHGIPGDTPQLEIMAKGLQNLANKAAGISD